MARLSRLSVAAVVHYVLQRGHNGGAIAHDDDDAGRLLQILRESALSSGVAMHAYAVTTRELRVLATPDSAIGISRMMQSLGRRYAALFNRRHGRSGALWDGRFRSALIESGAPTLLSLRHIDGLARLDGGAAADHGQLPTAPDMGTSGAGIDAVLRSSVGHRIGGLRDAALVDPDAYWQLGNTPFERESSYRALLAETLGEAERQALQRAVQGAWAFGSARFIENLSAMTMRPLAPRPRGRPPRST